MSRRAARFTYQAVRSEGGMLPYELLEQIGAHSHALGITPTGYYLAEHEPLGEAQSRAWLRLFGLWRSFKTERAKLPDSDPAVRLTRERWLLPLFQELGYGRLATAKGGLTVDGREFPISHIHAPAVPIHLMGAGVKLDTRTPNVAGAAQTSPHGLLQDFLNRSDPHLWGVVSNGLVLRLLRDSHTFTRRPYLEFDLEAMFDGELFADFRLLWLCAHASRLSPADATPDKPDSAAIEQWFRQAKDRGVRVRDRLGEGVKKAILQLGGGFLRHPQNTALQQALRSGQLSPLDFYRQLLRMVYRLIFVFVAEDRGVLQPPIPDELPPEQAAERRRAQDRFTRYYATAKIRELAQRRRGSPHGDRWIALRLILAKLHRGCPELDLPALGSALFDPATTPDLERAELANQELLPALRALCTFTDEAGIVRPVSWQNIGADELGSVFESLLELVPSLHRETGDFTLDTAAGNERKTTGSYYTPESLVECLLDSALDPVLDRACASGSAERALLALKVCDPACGSGHFLVAAGRRIAHRLAQVRAGDNEPSPEELRRALRDVYARCLYGVDINPMAVELCKVSLWMEAIDPKRPLPFLDGHIAQGNALLGATPALIAKGIPDDAFKEIEGDDKEVAKRLRKRNKDERTGKAEGVQRGLFLAGERGETAVFDYSRHRELTGAIEAMEDDTFDAIEAKERRYREHVQSAGVRELQLVADTWCSAFVWPKYGEHEESAPTHWLFEKIKEEPSKAPKETVAVVRELAREYEFLHWHLAFPQVFSVPGGGEEAEHPKCGWSGGFDAVLGNPPWDKVKLYEKEFFATRHTAIAEAKISAKRKRLISDLSKNDPELWREWVTALRRAVGESVLVRDTGLYPLCGRGDINTYSIFSELNTHLISREGRSGFIVPSGIATDATTQLYFRHLMSTGLLRSLYDFQSGPGLFAEVGHARFKFCLLTLGPVPAGNKKAEFAFFLRNVASVQDVGCRFELTADDMALLNPNTQTCPIFRSRIDAKITRGVYRRIPAFATKKADAPRNSWRADYCRMIDLTNDSGLFRESGDLEREGWRPLANWHVRGGKTMLPMYEAKMFHLFNHRFGDYSDKMAESQSTALPEIPSERLDRSDYTVSPRHWISGDVVDERLRTRWGKSWFLAWRDICRSSDFRTVIVSILPCSSVGNTSPLLFTREENVTALVSNLSSFALDYIARQKVGGIHLSFGVLDQLPILPPTAYDAPTPWNPSQTLADWILPRVLELTYTAWDLQGFARDHGYDGPPFRWNEERRFKLRAELDAAYFHLYGLTLDEVAHVMESFWLVRQRDKKAHDNYRTEDTILDLYWRMDEAIKKGIEYATVLDPPPAHPHPPVAHDELTPEQRQQFAPILERALADHSQPPTTLEAQELAPKRAEPKPGKPKPAKPKRARVKTKSQGAEVRSLFLPKVSLPLFQVAAGQPIIVDEEESWSTHVVVDASLLEGGNPRDFLAAKVHGDSMIDAAIYNGDYILIRKHKGTKPKQGDVVVVATEDGVTCKYFYCKGSQIWLKSGNPTMEDIPLRSSDFSSIVGKYIRVLPEPIEIVST